MSCPEPTRQTARQLNHHKAVCHVSTRGLVNSPNNMAVHCKHIFIESVRAHVFTKYGKPTGRP